MRLLDFSLINEYKADCIALLGLACWPCSEKDLKSAYRRRARETHPDVEGGNKHDFQRVADAYTFLLPRCVDSGVASISISESTPQSPVDQRKNFGPALPPVQGLW